MDCAHHGSFIVCGRGRRSRAIPCVACRELAGFQCDWKMPGGGTCDAWICPKHAQEVAPNKHLCPTHQAAYKEWLALNPTKAIEPAAANHATPEQCA